MIGNEIFVSSLPAALLSNEMKFSLAKHLSPIGGCPRQAHPHWLAAHILQDSHQTAFTALHPHGMPITPAEFKSSVIVSTAGTMYYHGTAFEMLGPLCSRAFAPTSVTKPFRVFRLWFCH